MQIKHSRKVVVAVAGGLKVPKPFSDNMVLQQEKPIHIRGLDAPGTDVAVTLDGQSRNSL